MRIARYHSQTAGAAGLKKDQTFGSLSLKDGRTAIDNAKRMWLEHGELFESLISNGIGSRMTCVPRGCCKDVPSVGYFNLAGNWDTGFFVENLGAE